VAIQIEHSFVKFIFQSNSDTESAFHESEGYEQLVQTLIDLFVAGTETTSSTLSFALLFMTREQEMQDRVRAEIHDVLGRDRFPESSDRQDLPFTEATLMEIQRMANVAPRGLLPHANMGGPIKVSLQMAFQKI
jgi:cytochrome P450 family 2 subfamily J